MGLGSAMLLGGCSGSGNSGSTGGGPVLSPTVAVTGGASTRLGGTTQFAATVANTNNLSVTWQVNGTTGGSSANGMITSTGTYTAPATLPSPNTVTISAVSAASASAVGTLSEAVWNPVPVVTAAAATQTGTASTVMIDVKGTSFVSGAQIQVGGASVTTTAVSSTELQASVAATTAASLAVDVWNPDPGAAASTVSQVAISVVKVPVAAASRLLDQATFGPTLADIQHVQTVGLDGYLTEQFATPATVLADVPNPQPATCTNVPANCAQSEWWQAALTGQDQLRERVAFALAEMFVISSNSVNGYTITPYQNLLTKDAFGNFSTVMKDVTLSTGMGAYLNMLNSYKPGNGQIANENYSRENMQLFTIGINELNEDGTATLDGSGNMIPAYTQAQVQAFARAYTGWTYATATGGSPTKYPNGTANFDMPMAAVESAHDVTAKVLLNGTTLPANQTAEQDLDGALANLFAHKNVGPFVCKQLIQHLVASNPSGAYVKRVATVFADNGSGVRGDLKAVVYAILMDPEARAGDTNTAAEGGHLREPVLYLANVMRGLGYSNTDPNGYYATLSNYSGNLSEKPYAAGSVFNFFPPSYVIPGTTVNAPEFSLENTASAVLRLTLANSLVYNGISGFTVDLSATSALGIMASKTGNAATDSGNLVDALGTIFMHGQMPTNMRTAIVNHVMTLTNIPQRVRVATYLVITSSGYKVMH
ncbi:protein of unknown function DUF1800 [Granulicella tundricola MP5ACTX9]|uniref:Uncharacterized protein n=2 Tax=Granulicella TaxID=940557 RepID=E8WY68_GRATM|nr:protein of unknown function DUF1800 [Granulicella tundricola MP5ACTX9]